MDKSPFSKLPAELRNKIYELVLSSLDPICTSAESDKHARISAITRVSKQMRNETVLLYHNLNSFALNLRQETTWYGLWRSEQKFEKYTMHIAKWASSKPRSHHQATRRLTVRLQVSRMSWGWPEDRADLVRLVKLLKRRGYKGDQVSIEVWVPRISYPAREALFEKMNSLGVTFEMVGLRRESGGLQWSTV